MLAAGSLALWAIGLPAPCASVAMQRSANGQPPLPSNMPVVLNEFDGREDDMPGGALDEFGNFQAELGRSPDAVIYDHMPKASGTFLGPLLQSAVGDDNFELRKEFDAASHRDSAQNFLIGSIRNPCNYYLSLWAYGADQHGRLRLEIPPDKRDVYNTSSPNKDSKHDDIKKFHDWVWAVNRDGFPGIMSVRFARSYAVMKDFPSFLPPSMMNATVLKSVRRALESPERILSRVSCWVRTESLDKDARACLTKWRDATGKKVDWKAYKTQYESGDQLQTAHGKCGEYFTPGLAAKVRKLEAPMFGAFNYTTCCS